MAHNPIYPDILALARAVNAVNLSRVTAASDAGQLCADLLSRAQNRTPRPRPPEPDDQGVLASCTAGPRKPAGGAVASYAM